MTTIIEFDRTLQLFDWAYDYTEDIEVWRAADTRYKELAEVAKESPQHLRLWQTYNVHFKNAQTTQIEDLNKVRVAVGAVTQEFLDELADEKKRKERDERDHLRLQLVSYDQVCRDHDWYYWRNYVDHPAYTRGIEQRQLLTSTLLVYTSYQQVIDNPQANPRDRAFIRLFVAHANLARCREAHSMAAWSEDKLIHDIQDAQEHLRLVRLEYGLLDQKARS